MASKIEKLQKKSDTMLEQLSCQADKTRDSFVDLLGAAVEIKPEELDEAIDLASVIEHQAIVSGIAATLNLLMDDEDDDEDG